LHWIYIRSGPNSPDLTKTDSGTLDSEEETALHAFFKTLATPYHLHQTDDPEAMASAVAEIDRQQNFPLTYYQQVPRLDHSAACFLAALLCCLGLLASRALQLQSWQTTT
jgi:mxaC protein